MIIFIGRFVKQVLNTETFFTNVVVDVFFVPGLRAGVSG
jgi:hypothetical protein